MIKNEEKKKYHAASHFMLAFDNEIIYIYIYS